MENTERGETPRIMDGKCLPGSSQFYKPEGWVEFFVYNHTGHDLIFENDVFGARSFVFDGEEARWEEIDLGSTPGEFGPRRLENEATEFYEMLAGFPTRRMNTKGYNEILLLVIGYAEDTPVVEAYGAYADIKIVEGSDPDVVLVTLTPSTAP